MDTGSGRIGKTSRRGVRVGSLLAVETWVEWGEVRLVLLFWVGWKLGERREIPWIRPRRGLALREAPPD